MHIVAIAWMFVVVLMAVAEATSTQGTVLGAFFTLLLYGALPLSIVLYVLGTPGRKRARQLAEAAEQAAASAGPADGNGGGQAPGAGLTPERKEP
ncbi:hypothetical protein [Pseudaquabacterium pictum]|uniref:Transmembrane protein n=1 Tax=Pseudaquabacterium pictum TaxID=2315236 RepID=A0A480AM33_9BURK|nr:hypothetical protein [Rubrivivax pictus]GCL61062.1 hypothetical protein AQPW35_01430 [Rubrivivax pictus]